MISTTVTEITFPTHYISKQSKNEAEARAKVPPRVESWM